MGNLFIGKANASPANPSPVSVAKRSTFRGNIPLTVSESHAQSYRQRNGQTSHSPPGMKPAPTHSPSGMFDSASLCRRAHTRTPTRGALTTKSRSDVTAVLQQVLKTSFDLRQHDHSLAFENKILSATTFLFRIRSDQNSDQFDLNSQKKNKRD